MNQIEFDPSPRDKIRNLLSQAIQHYVNNQYEAAEIQTREALELFNQNFFSEQDRWAENAYQRAIPLLENWEFAKALSIVTQVYQQRLDHRDAYIAILRCLWCLEKYEEFWHYHEDRRQMYRNLIAYERIYGKAKMWNGHEPLDGKKVLVYCESGMGDQIQFLRYVPLLKEKYDCKIILNYASVLYPLFRTLPFVDQHVFKEHVSSDLQPEFDLHVPSMSLPLYLEQYEPLQLPETLSLYPEPVGYNHDFRAGFIFTPNPGTYETPDKIINVAWASKLVEELPNVQFFNLHHKEKACINGVTDLCDQIHDFGNLAAYVNSMDVIIGCDSAILHVAGSLRKKTIGLIPRNGNWRWGTKDTSPWYPTINLIHQEKSGDWDSVFDRLVVLLNGVVGT